MTGKLTTTGTETIELDGDGILHIVAMRGSVHGKEEALENIEACLSIVDKPAPALIDISKAAKIDKYAQNIYFGKENKKCVSKAAVLTSSAVSAFIGNLLINNKSFSVRFFSDESMAVEWLKSSQNDLNLKKSEILPFLEKVFPPIALLLTTWLVINSESKLPCLSFCIGFIIYNVVTSKLINKIELSKHDFLEFCKVVGNSLLLFYYPLGSGSLDPVWILLILAVSRLLLVMIKTSIKLLSIALLISASSLGLYFSGASLSVWTEPAFVIGAISLLCQVMIFYLLSTIKNLLISEQQLVLEKEKAIYFAKTKSEFLANMSHEIRTPMNGVLGNAELLSGSEKLSKIEKRHVKNILESGTSMMDILNDILDFSKIEAGQLKVDFHNFNLYSLLHSIANLYDQSASEKYLFLDLKISSNTPKWVCFDSTRLRQILSNLLSNAIKFTEKGGVTLQVSGAEDNPFQLTFEIIDTGIGINPEQVDRIFESFSQADSSTTRQFGGTGLGLSICKNLIQMFGGTISVDSTPGKGSNFSFSVLIKEGHPEEVESINNSESSFNLSSLRVLLVEDNAINRDLASAFLDSYGITPDIAINGDEAVKKTQVGKYDIILMDCQMPVKDGYQATKEIRLLPLDSQPVIIAMTANVMAGESQKCIDMGMDDYVSKPISKKKLNMTLKKWVELSQKRTAA